MARASRSKATIAAAGSAVQRSDEDSSPVAVQRKSSRSTAFRGEMKDPSNSIADLLKYDEMVFSTTTSLSNSNGGRDTGGSSSSKRRGARQSRRSSLEMETDEDEDESDEDDKMYDSPPTKKRKSVAVKSPAIRHSKRRMSKHVNTMSEESSEDEMISDEDDDVDDEEEHEMKINKIIACKSMTLSEWTKLCAKMQTSEITNGSVWIQEDAANTAVVIDKYEERFLVKWNDLSYLHCSWETEKDLVEFCEGAKGRLSTFFRKAEGGLLYEADERLDGDYFDPSWITVDRILEVLDPDNDDNDPTEIILDIDHPKFDSGTGRQFYIKWVNKTYSECTYEFERDLILNDVDYKEHLALYDKRKAKPTREDMRRRSNENDVEVRKMYKIFGDKIKKSDDEREASVKEYQDALAARVFKNGGQLRDYQAEGVSWLMSNHLNKRSSILADEMGLGKTIQTATYVNMVSQQLATRGPFLIIAPLSTIPHWYREFTGWTDLNTIVYHGSSIDREHARENEFAFPEDRVEDVAFNQRYLMKVAKKWRSNWEKTWMVEVVITTPEMLVTEDFTELMAVKWEILVVDEAHRLKNHNSKLAQNLRDKRFEFNQSLLLTGTPIQNNMQEMWTLLNFINPDSFDDLDVFMKQYGDIKSKEKVDELHETIRPYILRRLKEDVEKSVPPKEETLIEVELTVLQKQYYRALYEKNVKFLHRDKSPIDGPSLNNLAMQLRKCCNHPFLLTGVENEVRLQKPNTNDVDSLVNSSGKFVLLDKLLPRLKADGHRILLFSQFKIMLDIIEDYLHLRDFKCERIDGSITGMKRQAAIDRFQSKGTNGREQPFIMLLSTRAGGVGINLTAADTVIIFDSDWNPQNDLQAQARCHRIGQTKNVKIYRLLTRKTYEMQMFHMSSMKMGLDQAVLQGIENSGGKDIMTKDEVERLLKHGAYDIFKEDKDGTSEKESNDFVSQDIDSILARAKNIVHDNTGSNSNAAGGTFSKASFKNINSDGVAATEVDVDDPDFWTKVVGDTKAMEDEDQQLGKRKRAEHSFNEKEYLKRLDAAIKDGVVGSDVDDDASMSSEWSGENVDNSEVENDHHDDDALRTIVKAAKSNERERYLWGGSSRSEWKQHDAELVLKLLGNFGYGNLEWKKFAALLSLSKAMKLDEIKRMSWSLTLLCLYEAAEVDALEVTRKAEADSTEKGTMEGDILARTGNIESSELAESNDKTDDERDILEESFKKLLSINAGWVEMALGDAVDFSKISSHRDQEYVQGIIDGNRPSNLLNPVQSKLVADFMDNVWPALRSRGWKEDEKNKHLFIYQGKTFKSIALVLDAVPKLHPELTSMVHSLISSIAATCKQPAAVDNVTKLDLKCVTAASLKSFLMDFAPMQLLADRKGAHRIGLVKRLLSKLVLLHAVHKIVATVDSTPLLNDSPQERNLLLSQAIFIDPQSSLPHKDWTLLHDAILIRAVVKHGWLDSLTNCAAIANDKTIHWGAPFEVSDESIGEEQRKPEAKPRADTSVQADYDNLYNTASRAVNFLQELYESFADGLPAPVLNEIREQMIDSYGVTRNESDERWEIQKDKLQEITKLATSKANECETLPSKKRLIKRLKRLAMSFAGVGSSSDEHPPKTVEKQKYGFCVIDLSDRHNALLSAVIKVQLFLKQSVKPVAKVKQSELIFHEVDARIKDLARSDGSHPMIQSLEQIKKDVKTYVKTFRKSPRASKNILRAIIGLEPVMPKVKSEPLFATEDVKPSASSVATKAAMTKLKNMKAFTSADTVLNRALSLYTEEDKDGVNDCLHLTSTEVLLLTVLASQGLPVFSERWASLISSETLAAEESNGEREEEHKLRIFYFAMTQVMHAAAEVWLSIARKKLSQERDIHNDSNVITERDCDKIALLKKDHDFKEMTLMETKTYADNPNLFAKKCIMLLEAIRKNMGPVDLQYVGEKKIRQLNKSENGLGTKVVHWFSKDLQKWAVHLGALDKEGNVLSTTSITGTKDHPQLHDAALMTKRDCRTVFIQIAQQTRLRSIFLKHGMERLSTELIPKVVKQSSFIATEWGDSPSWWNVDPNNGISPYCQDDIDLLVGILDYGYGGFDSLLNHDFSFCKRLSAEGCNDYDSFTRSTVQVRINNLTRKLHEIDEREDFVSSFSIFEKK